MPVPYIIIEQKAPPRSGRTDEIIAYPRLVYNRLAGTAEIARLISKTSTISTGDLMGVLYSLAEQIALHLADGNKVVLDGIGSFSLTGRTGALEDPENLQPSDFRYLDIRFEHDKKLLRSAGDLSFIQKR